jgi:hypothetical protein
MQMNQKAVIDTIDAQSAMSHKNTQSRQFASSEAPAASS